MNDLDLAQRIASQFFGCTPQTLRPIVGKGSVNHIFVAGLDEAEIVIRLSAIGDKDRAMKFYQKEQWCIEQATELGIPGPTVLALDVLDGRPYMLQTCVAGVNGEDSALGDEAICFALGQYARRIHSIALNGFGEELADFHRGDGMTRWQGWVVYNLDSLTPDDALRTLGVYEREQAEAIRYRFELLKNMPVTLALTHGDLSARNTIVDDIGRIALLDWGCAEAHLAPHYDLLCLTQQAHFREAHLHSFAAGYGLSADAFARVSAELTSLKLLKAFDLVRWAIDRSPTHLREKVDDARRTVLATMNTK